MLPLSESTAIKIFTHLPKFEQELAVYERLHEWDVTKVLGFNVPSLVASSRKLLIIEMTIVKPPFLLDFEISKLDEDQSFDSSMGTEEWWDRLRPLFGRRLPMVRDVFYYLSNRYGIYYYDLAPRNMDFTNHPDDPGE